MEKSNRIVWIDIAKGMGIILVVFGHICTDVSFYKWVYSFHVALFFFLTGYLFKTYRSTDEFIRKKVSSLIFPYIAGGIIVDALYNGIKLLNGRLGIREYFSLIYSVQSALLKGNWNALADFNSPLWFIPCLVTTEIIFYIIVRVAREKKVIWWVCLYVVTLANLKFFPLIDVWHFTEAFSWLFWICLGYCLKDKVSELSNVGNYKLGLIIIIGLPFSFGGAQLYEQISKARCEMAFIGIAVTLAASMLIARWDLGRRLLAYVGRETMGILIMHIYFIRCIAMLFGSAYKIVEKTPILSFGITIIIIACNIVILFVYKKIKFELFKFPVFKRAFIS